MASPQYNFTVNRLDRRRSMLDRQTSIYWFAMPDWHATR